MFIIDPEGILTFAATYPLEVRRNTEEVQRIVKVSKRAKELSHLQEFERGKGLSNYDQ